MTRVCLRDVSQQTAGRVGLLVISLFMSGVMSAVMTILNSGPDAAFWWHWLKAWGVGLFVSFPVASVVVPRIVRWQAKLSEP